MQEARDFLEQAGVTVISGPVARTGSEGVGTSLYVRDPDDNLIELMTYGDPAYA